MLPNASYFAFTATPKNKTLEIFGAGLPGGRAGQAPRLPQLHHEAGHPGGLYPRRAEQLHAGGQLLPAGQDGGRRPRIRHPEGAEKAAPLRRVPRPRHPPQGRDHGRSLSRPGDGPTQDRRPGAGHGGHQRHRARHPVLLCHSRLPGGAQEPLPGHRRLFRGARVRRRQGHRGVAQRLPQQPDRRQDPGGSLPLPGVRGKVPDRLRRAAAAHHVRGQDPVGHQGRTDALPAEPRPSPEARRLCPRLYERRRHDPGRLRRLLPDDHPQRGNRPRQAARPEGRPGRLPGL